MSIVYVCGRYYLPHQRAKYLQCRLSKFKRGSTKMSVLQWKCQIYCRAEANHRCNYYLHIALFKMTINICNALLFYFTFAANICSAGSFIYFSCRVGSSSPVELAIWLNYSFSTNIFSLTLFLLQNRQ